MSARDALDAALERIAACADPAVVISAVPSDVLGAWADLVDEAPAADVPLRGTTFAVKDNIDVACTVTTAACPSFGIEPAWSATVVGRLLAAGALPVVKTNLDQFATGLVGVRSPYGTPRNPFDPALVPGGSSSGSALAVALGLTDFALGTDTAGSGRVPAAMCGLVGLKPTRGWLSTAGVVPAVRSIDCVSVFAPTVASAWSVASIAGGHDPADPFSRRVPASVGGVARVAGVLDPALLDELGVDGGIVDGYTRWCATLADAGVATQVIDPRPLFSIGDLLYGGPWVAERFAAVGEFVMGDHLGVDPVVRSIIADAQRWQAVDAHRAAYRLAELCAEVAALFDDVDLVVTPTVAHLTTVAEVAVDPLGANARLGRFTTFSNLADLCALTLPVDVPPAGATRPPVSVSLHAPAWADEMLVRTAQLVAGEPTTVAPRGWITLAVAGAHLRGQPLEHQLTDRHAVWLGTTCTASSYCLYALDGTVPPKPGLVRADGGTSIEVDVWALAPAEFGGFVDQVPAPLCIGTVELADGTTTRGFLCETGALSAATDITHHGGWRAYRSAG